MMTMEGVVLKLPSFSQLINPNSISSRSPLKFRFNFAISSSSYAIVYLSVPAAAPVSLGHATRPDFEVLHQLLNLLNQKDEVSIESEKIRRERICMEQLTIYDAPVASEPNKIGLGTKIGVGVAVVAFGLVFALEDFIPSGRTFIFIIFKALNRVAGVERTCDFTKDDFMKMLFSDNSFGEVYAIEATCHAPDAVGCYKEIFRVLKSGQSFASYEWCMTDAFDPNNQEQSKIKEYFSDTLNNLSLTSIICNLNHIDLNS